MFACLPSSFQALCSQAQYKQHGIALFAWFKLPHTVVILVYGNVGIGIVRDIMRISFPLKCHHLVLVIVVPLS